MWFSRNVLAEDFGRRWGIALPGGLRTFQNLGGNPAPHNVTVCSPHVRLLGPDVAVVSYVRIVQRLGDDGKPVSSRSEETRVWQRQAGQWRHVHFHRSV